MKNCYFPREQGEGYFHNNNNNSPKHKETQFTGMLSQEKLQTQQLQHI